MKASKKRRALESLCEHLRSFIPSIHDTYICPTCLERVPLSKPELITKAHIVPRSAEGVSTTWLCQRCNSEFGSKQDKWFGEFIQVKRDELSLFDTPSKAKHFELDGLRFGSTYRTNSSGGIDFLIHEDRTSPTNMAELRKRSKARNFHGSSITFSAPLFANKDLINPGFLTAAYLMWFRELGYSWVLQTHLNEVREQIRNPESEILKHRYIFEHKGEFVTQPWIGFLKANEEVYLSAAIADRIVVLPAADGLPVTWLNAPSSMTASYRQLEFFGGRNYRGPLGIMYKDRVLVIPDQLLQRELKGVVAFYPDWTSRPIQMYPLPEDEYKRQLGEENVATIRARGKLKKPKYNTGESNERKR